MSFHTVLIVAFALMPLVLNGAFKAHNFPAADVVGAISQSPSLARIPAEAEAQRSQTTIAKMSSKPARAHALSRLAPAATPASVAGRLTGHLGAPRATATYLGSSTNLTQRLELLF